MTAAGALSLAGSVLVSAAWIPILARFLRSWRARKNPISLAIAMLVALTIYVPVWASAGPKDPWLQAGLVASNALACAFFHLSFKRAEESFPDDRKR